VNLYNVQVSHGKNKSTGGIVGLSQPGCFH